MANSHSEDLNTLYRVLPNIPRTSGLAGKGPADYGLLANGEIVLVNRDGIILDATTVLKHDTIRTLQRVVDSKGKDKLIYGTYIHRANVTEYYAAKHAPDREEEWFVGFPGVALLADGTLAGPTDYICDYGSGVGLATDKNLVADCSGCFCFSVLRKDGANYNLPGFYSFDWCPGCNEVVTSELLAYKLAQKGELILGPIQDMEAIFTVTRVVNLIAAATAVAGTATVENFSNIVKLSAAPAVPVGDYVIIEGSAYKVIAVDAVNNTLTLDLAYQGENKTGITITSTTVANIQGWGIKVKAIRRAYDYNCRSFFKYRFQVQGCNNVCSSDITHRFNAVEGRGQYEQIDGLERHGKVFDGQPGFTINPDCRECWDPLVLFAKKGAKYSTIHLQSKTVHSSRWRNPDTSLVLETFAIEKTNNGDVACDDSQYELDPTHQILDATTGLLSLLNIWLTPNVAAGSTTPGYPNGINGQYAFAMIDSAEL